MVYILLRNCCRWQADWVLCRAGLPANRQLPTITVWHVCSISETGPARPSEERFSTSPRLPLATVTSGWPKWSSHEQSLSFPVSGNTLLGENSLLHEGTVLYSLRPLKWIANGYYPGAQCERPMFQLVSPDMHLRVGAGQQCERRLCLPLPLRRQALPYDAICHTNDPGPKDTLLTAAAAAPKAPTIQIFASW